VSSARVTPLSPDVAVAYLARDPGANVELLVSLRHDVDVSCSGVWVGDEVVGVMVTGRAWAEGPLTAMIEAEEREAVSALAGALPPGTLRFAVHRPRLLPLLDAVFHLTPIAYGGLLVLTAQTLAMSPVSDVRLLTAADTAVVAVSVTPWGHEGFADALKRGYRPFGIVREGRVVARAMAAYATGYTEEVSAVWTAPAWRGKGLATAVAATVAADIRTRVPLAVYTVRPDNLASRRIAEKVGFALDHQTNTYRVSKRL